MSKPAIYSRIDGHTLLRWCGYAVMVGLFVGVGIGATIVLR
jgi:hypothetical protein